jgi:hypothetical protein
MHLTRRALLTFSAITILEGLIMVYSPAQTQALAEVAGAFDSDNARLADLTAQLAACQETHDTDQATIADLEQQLADCQAGHKPPMLALNVGVRTNVSPMAGAVATFGKGSTSVTRIFENTLTPAWDRTTEPWGDHWVVGQIPIVSYKDPQKNLASYAKSLESLNGQMGYHHEPEADYGTDGKTGGAKFVSEFVKEYDTAKAASSKTLFGMIAGAYQYRANGGLGYNGDFLPPKEKVDFYALDTYQTGGTGPNVVRGLENDARFQRWYSFVKDRGKPLYLTEYGRGLVTDKAQDSLRVQAIRDDIVYLTKIGVKVWIYWWTTGKQPDGTYKDWQFKDAGSISAWSDAGK